MALLVVVVMVCGGGFAGLGAGTALAAGTGTAITVQVPQPLVATGGATETVTATVTDANGGVTGDTVSFSATPNTTGAPLPTFGAVQDLGNGQYTATLTTSSAEGSYLVTATDTTSQPNGTPLVGSAALTQYGAPSLMVLGLGTSSLVADGNHSTVATVRVFDAALDAVPGDTSLTLAASPSTGLTIGAVTDHQDGSYTATITSTTTLGSFTISGSDGSVTSNSQTLAAITGPPAFVTLTPFSPGLIFADGISASTTTATVTDVAGHGLSGQSLQVVPSDPADQTSVTDNGNGTYTIKVLSSLNTGVVTVGVADGSVSAQPASFLQALRPATGISLSLSSGSLTADGSSTTTATIAVTDAQGRVIAGDAPNLDLQPSDSHVTVGQITAQPNGLYAATVTSSTTAHPVTLTASENRDHLSASASLSLVHGPPSLVSLALSPTAITADGISTSMATVTIEDAHGNPIAGEPVRLSTTDRRVKIGPITDHGNGTYTAKVRAANVPETVQVTAVDGHSEAVATLAEMRAPSLPALASMQWSFYYTPRYTLLQAMTLTGAPAGSRVLVLCHGKGCPFARRTVTAVVQHCPKGRKHRCKRSAGLDLARRLPRRRLKVGNRLIVEILRPGWIGKYYSFVVRGGHAPKITISCLAPGGTRPGVGCR